MPLVIPERYKKAFTQLANLDPDNRSKLIEALSKIEPSFSYKSIISQLYKTVEGIEKTDLEEILHAILSLYNVVDRAGFSLEKLADEVSSLILSKKTVDFNKDSEEFVVLKAFFQQVLLLGDSLGIASKVVDVLTQHENPLRAVRILTDLRPIFSIGEDPKIAAGVVIHNLKLTVGLSRPQKTFFVALDSQDLDILKKEIDRAIKKEIELKRFAENSNLSCIDPAEL